jgi:hypothetical protein
MMACALLIIDRTDANICSAGTDANNEGNQLSITLVDGIHGDDDDDDDDDL